MAITQDQSVSRGFSKESRGPFWLGPGEKASAGSFLQICIGIMDSFCGFIFIKKVTVFIETPFSWLLRHSKDEFYQNNCSLLAN